MNGILYLYSYRDVHCLKTYENFIKAIDFGASGNFSEEDINDAKIACIARIDKPINPLNRGLIKFEYEIDDSVRDHFRSILLNATHQMLVDAAKRLQEALKQGETSRVCFVGNDSSKNELLKENWRLIDPMDFTIDI